MMWMNLVEMYSARRLTKSSDKLIAISAVAQVISQLPSPGAVGGATRPPLRYLAGLFQEYLPGQLAWFMKHPDDQRGQDPVAHEPQKLSPYRAPTWSWASRDGQIIFDDWYDDPTTQMLAEVEDDRTFVIPIVEGDATGGVKWAELTVTGKVIPVVLRTVGQNSGGASQVKTQVSAGTGCNLTVKTDLIRTDVITGHDEDSCWPGDCPGCGSCAVGSRSLGDATYCCLLLFKRHAGGSAVLLVLERSITTEQAWKRVGIVLMFLNKDSERGFLDTGCETTITIV